MLTLSYGLWRVWVPLANTPLPSLIVPFCSRIYGGPQLSRQKQNTSRQNRKPNGKNKNLTAKPKTSRQKQKPHGKTENFVYFVFAVKFLVLPWRILFLPWGFWFCREVFGFAVTVVGHHTNQILILKYDFYADIKLIVWSCALYL